MRDPHTSWAAVTFGLALGVFAAYQQFKLPPTLPLMLELYGYDRRLAGGFISVYAAVGLVLSLRLGTLLQRHGPTRYLLAAAGLMAAGCLLALAAPEAGAVVLAARGLEGVAYTVLAVAGPAIAARSAAPRHMTLAMALSATWVPAGQLLANGLARPALAAGAWAPLWWAGIVLSGLLALWILALRRRGGPALAGWGGGAGGTPPDAAERACLRLAALAFMLWSTQLFALLTWLPQYLIEAHGLDRTGAIDAYSVPILFILVMNLATGWLLRAGAPAGPLLAAALALQAAVWLLLPVLGPVTGLAALMVYGIGAGIAPTCLFAMPALILGRRRAGPAAFGVIMTARNLGVLIGPVLLAEVFSRTADWERGGPIFGAVAAAAVAIALWLSLRLRALAASRRG